MYLDWAHLKESALKHWVSTLVGVGVGAYELLEPAGLDFTAMSWAEIRTRLLKALFFSALGAAVRVAKTRE